MVLIGIPASGKSTFAQEIMEDRDDIVYLSSDSIRDELFGDETTQSKNNEVFSHMLKMTKQALEDGKHVIYDATNISRKRRKGLLQQLPKELRKVAVYLDTDLKEVKERNMKRNRVVPESVINRMYKNLQTPIYSEGWDNIVYHHSDDTMLNQLDKQFSDMLRVGVLFGREGYELMNFLATYFNEFFKILDMPQDSKYHAFSVSRHTYYVYKYVLDNYKTEDETEREMMLWTALLHDIGKSECKSFISRKGEETRYANFIGHDNVGSQIAINLLHRLNFPDEFIYEVSQLIQFHMYLLNEQASREKLIGYVGQNTFEKLEFLREADTQSH